MLHLHLSQPHRKDSADRQGSAPDSATYNYPCVPDTVLLRCWVNEADIVGTVYLARDFPSRCPIKRTCSLGPVASPLLRQSPLRDALLFCCRCCRRPRWDRGSSRPDICSCLWTVWWNRIYRYVIHRPTSSNTSDVLLGSTTCASGSTCVYSNPCKDPYHRGLNLLLLSQSE